MGWWVGGGAASLELIRFEIWSYSLVESTLISTAVSAYKHVKCTHNQNMHIYTCKNCSHAFMIYQLLTLCGTKMRHMFFFICLASQGAPPDIDHTRHWSHQTLITPWGLCNLLGGFGPLGPKVGGVVCQFMFTLVLYISCQQLGVMCNLLGVFGPKVRWLCNLNWDLS